MIELIGQKGTPEHDAAVAISEAFIKTWPGIETTPKEEEHVKIASCVKLSGQKVSDIDVVLVGQLRPNRFIVPKAGAKDADGNSLVSTKVRVKSFIAAIEVKDHPAENMVVEAGGILVKIPRWLEERDGTKRTAALRVIVIPARCNRRKPVGASLRLASRHP